MFWNVILKYKYNSWHFPVFRLSSLFCEYLNFFQPNRPYRSLACSWLCLLLNILDGSGLWEKYWLWKINSRCLWNHSITAFYLIWIQRNSRLSKREHVWWMDVIWWLCHFGECIHWVTTRWERVICCCFIPCEFLLAILRVSLDINLHYIETVCCVSSLVPPKQFSRVILITLHSLCINFRTHSIIVHLPIKI